MAANVNFPGVVPGVRSLRATTIVATTSRRARGHLAATVGRVIAATAEAALFAWTIVLLGFCLLVLSSFFLA
jgi:hypothetical protein